MNEVIPSYDHDIPESSSLPSPAPEAVIAEQIFVDRQDLVNPERFDAYKAWLEGRRIDPDTLPRITMDKPTFEALRNCEPKDQRGIRSAHGIPQEDQQDYRYIFVDLEQEGLSTLILVNVSEVGFGAVLDPPSDLLPGVQRAVDPDEPSNPNAPRDALHTVDITETLTHARRGLNRFASLLMEGKAEDPFDRGEGVIGIRAGQPAPGQKDAYVRTNDIPFTEAVALTVNFPSRYESVCLIRGDKFREAANGKRGMAQIDNPETVLVIEGYDLARLKNLYNEIYYEPDYALSDNQRDERDQIFNDFLTGLITEKAKENQQRANSTPARVRRSSYEVPHEHYREIPSDTE